MIRQPLAFERTIRNTRDAGQQLLERRVNLEDHPCSALCQQRDIAAKLDRIAQSFLVMQQQALAGDRLLSQPQRLVPASAIQTKRTDLPTPLRFEPARFEITN